MEATRVSKRLLARAGRLQREDNGLLNLPIELFTEVAITLDWKDVLHLRQTCKHLSQATREKYIWIHFFHVSNVCHPWTPLRLERPLQFSTSEELEYLVVRRTSWEMQRKTSTKLPLPLMHRLPINKSDICALTLINGGRRLLIVSRFGSVSYYDLDTQEPVKRFLIPAAPLKRRNDYFPCTAKIAVDMDNKSALLSFNIALYTCKAHSSEPRNQLIQVWHVTLKADDQNHGRSLSATFLSSFHREDFGNLHSLSLLGSFVAFGVRINEGYYVAIVDWANLKVVIHNPSHWRHLTSLSYPRKIIYDTGIPNAVQLLPGDKILVASDYSVRLHDTLSVEPTADIPSADWNPPTWPYPAPTWARTDFPKILGISQLYYCGNTNEFRLILGTWRCIYGIIIPSHIAAGSQPKMVELLPLESCHWSDRCRFGYNSAVMIRCELPYLHLHYYPWPEGSSESPVGPSNSLFRKLDEKTIWCSKYCYAFDECSGRLVVTVEDVNDVAVYDFAEF